MLIGPHFWRCYANAYTGVSLWVPTVALGLSPRWTKGAPLNNRVDLLFTAHYGYAKLVRHGTILLELLISRRLSRHQSREHLYRFPSKAFGTAVANRDREDDAAALEALAVETGDAAVRLKRYPETCALR